MSYRKGKSQSLPGGSSAKMAINQSPQKCLSSAQAPVDQASQRLSSLSLSSDSSSVEVRAPIPSVRTSIPLVRAPIPSLISDSCESVESESSECQYGRRFDREISSDSDEFHEPPIEDWVCVPTEKHPEEDKPLHRGKITSFRDLFTKTFLLHKLYDPNSRGLSARNYKNIEVVQFDGRSIEMFREFEQSVLIRIINNDTLDFDGKFHMLLHQTSGLALSLVQTYTDILSLGNFVQAIEKLYYSYGHSGKFREALVRKLINQEPIDINKPETLQNINNLISKVFRAVGGQGNEVLTSSFIMSSIKMAPETAVSFRMWLSASMKEKSLKVLQQWLEHMSVIDVVETLEKPTHGSGSAKRQPLLINFVDSSKLEEPYNRSMDYRCPICFDGYHDFAHCSIYMKLTPDQRKLTLWRYDYCFKCTAVRPIVHIGPRCDCKMNCQECQSPDHHFTICKASVDPWKAVLSQ